MRATIGVFTVGLGALFAFAGYVRLGFGRHGDVWWKPLTNPMSTAHVENLASFALGITAMVTGVWVLITAVRPR